jgi:hypothetical protein
VSGCILKPYRTAFYSPSGGNKIDKILSDKDPICSSASNHDSPVLRVRTKPGGWGIKIKTGSGHKNSQVGWVGERKPINRPFPEWMTKAWMMGVQKGMGRGRSSPDHIGINSRPAGAEAPSRRQTATYQLGEV